MKQFLTIILLFSSMLTSAEIYKWVDENGRVHFGDNPSKSAKRSAAKLDMKVNTYSNVSYERAQSKTENVIMYSASWCAYCKKARKYFKKNNIAFIEYDIETDKSANRRHKAMGARGVPVILFKDKRMNGFSESGFRRIYDSGS